MSAMSSTIETSHEPHDGPPKLSMEIPRLQNLPDRSKSWENVPLPIEVLLVTVKDWEFLACFAFLKNQFYSYCADVGRVYFGEIGEENISVALVKCSEASAGPGGALSKAKSAIAILRPKVVFCVGFCGGLSREKTNLGDVIISRKLTTYDHRKVMENGDVSRGNSAPVSALVADLLHYAGCGWKAPVEEPAGRDVQVHPDAEILSGPELVNSLARRNELLRKHPAALAIEMEGQGIFAAAHDLKVEWAVVKGISDYADGTKSSTDNWRPFASVMAASVVANILKGPGVLTGWEHYKGLSQATGFRPTVTTDEALPDYKTPLSSLVQFITGGAAGQVRSGGRLIGYKTLGRIHSPRKPWVYDAEAWDTDTRTTANVRNFPNRKDAIQAAVREVTETLKAAGIID